MEFLTDIRPVLIGLLGIVLSSAATLHAISTKREVRAAIGWVGLVWLVPFLGAALYAMAGVNRIRRKGGRIRRKMHTLRPSISPLALGANREAPPLAVDDERIGPTDEEVAYAGLARTTTEVTGLELVEGNSVEILVNGDEAYPEMLTAIEEAEHTIGLASYIFDQDAAGERFVGALDAARRRGVDVRVLIDAVGALYSNPRTPHVLTRQGIPNASFLRTVLPWRAPFINLRNHRKLLVVDGRLGFTGGLNIRAGCIERTGDFTIQDLHFKLEGPIVAHLVEAFVSDWEFTTQERLEGPGWFPPLPPRGEIAARGIPDGPDEDFETLHWSLLAALAAARRSVRIVTPYFLPDQVLPADS